jgi:hypothetical protein
VSKKDTVEEREIEENKDVTLENDEALIEDLRGIHGTCLEPTIIEIIIIMIETCIFIMFLLTVIVIIILIMTLIMTLITDLIIAVEPPDLRIT